jgi:integrase
VIALAWVVQRRSGKWQAKYRIPGVGDRSAGTFDDEQTALFEAMKAEEAHRTTRVDPKNSETLWGDWFRTWIDAHSVAFATENTYRSLADNHLMPEWEGVKLRDIDTLGIQRWLKNLSRPRRERGVLVPARSVYIIHNSLQLLKTTLNAAVRHKRLSVNPAADIAQPTLPRGLERYLTPDEVEAITFQADGLNSTVIWTGVETGMRFGEMAGLHVNRINFDRGVIQILEQYDQHAGVIKAYPKDEEGRWVPMSHNLADILRRLLDQPREVRKTCGIPHEMGKCTGDLVFRGPRAAPLSSKDWGRGPWNRAVRAAGIEGRVRPHDLRHTYASWLLQQGVTLAELMYLMGHSSVEVTMKYAHFAQEQTFEIVRQALANHRRGAGRGAATAISGYTANRSIDDEQAI